MARGAALAAVAVAALLAVSGAGGAPSLQTPKRGGTLGLVTAFEPSCLSPVVDPCQRQVLPVYGVIEGAFKLGPDYRWRPRLVSHVDFARKPPFTLTYHIRPEARWSDGVPVTARDFRFTHRVSLDGPARPLDDRHREHVQSIRALDAKTVRVVLGGATRSGAGSSRWCSQSMPCAERT